MKPKKYLNVIVVIYSDPEVRIWNGDGEVTINHNKYLGAGELLDVGEMEVAAGSPDKRLHLGISGIPLEFRKQFLQDQGPLRVDIGFIGLQHDQLHDDVGLNNIPNFIIQGRISTPYFAEGELAVEIESKRGKAPDGEFIKVSHEDQIALYPDDDGLEYTGQLAREGFETKWPP